VESVIRGNDHLSADDVFRRERRRCPTVSGATMYNTLRVQKHLLTTQILKEGNVVFDANAGRHHLDERSGAISDILWESLIVEDERTLTLLP
jgi:Fe2+ or Zn2+ uptake regulation protein